MAARTLEAAAPTNESQALAAIFFHLSGASQLIDVEVSVSCPCKVIRLSDEVGLWDMIKKVKTKRQVCPTTMVKNSWNPNWQACSCRAPWINLELSWSDDLSKLPIFLMQLCIFRYTVQCTLRQSTGKKLVQRALFGKIHGRHFFPTTKWCKKSLNSVTVHL